MTAVVAAVAVSAVAAVLVGVTTIVVRLRVAAVVSTGGSGTDSRSTNGCATSDASGGIRMSNAAVIGVVRRCIRMAHVGRSRRGSGSSRDQRGYVSN